MRDRHPDYLLLLMKPNSEFIDVISQLLCIIDTSAFGLSVNDTFQNRRAKHSAIVTTEIVSGFFEKIFGVEIVFFNMDMPFRPCAWDFELQYDS